jgi:predicted ester cyclase
MVIYFFERNIAMSLRHIENGRLFGCEGKKGRVGFRLLHVFEFSGDKISRENVWCDLSAIQQQLGAKIV